MAKLPIHETRRLVLPLETAVDAVLELDREYGGTLAHGTIVKAYVESDAAPGLMLEVRTAADLGVERRRFTLPAIAAAFINYCWKARIPIPRSGTKRIEVVPEGFAITIECHTEVVRRHGEVPKAAKKRAASAAVPEAAAEDGLADTAEHAPGGDVAAHAAVGTTEDASAETA
jgi:hypothetical protein